MILLKVIPKSSIKQCDDKGSQFDLVDNTDRVDQLHFAKVMDRHYAVFLKEAIMIVTTVLRNRVIKHWWMGKGSSLASLRHGRTFGLLEKSRLFDATGVRSRTGVVGGRDFDVRLVTDDWGETIKAVNQVALHDLGWKICGLLTGFPGEHFFCRWRQEYSKYQNGR